VAVVAAVSAATLGLAWADASGLGSSSGNAAAKRSIPPTTRLHKMTIAAVKHRTVRVKLFGEKGFRARRIAPWSLRLRTKGPELSSGWRRHHAFKILGDTNDDGFADARATFRISLNKRVAAGHSHAEVIGILADRRHRGHHHRALRVAASTSSDTDTWTSFSASTELVTSDAASDYCTVGSSGYDVRCAFTTSFDELPVYLGVLVEDVNSDLSDAGYSFEITSSDSVQVELFGGAGTDGSDIKKCAYNTGSTSFGGDGGDGGYAQSAQTLSALEALGSGEARGALYVYVGQDGPSSQNGGSSSMLLAESIPEVTDVQDPASETFVGIAGGGGGGGAASSYSEFPVGCRDGHSGGDGGTAVATSAASVAGSGQDGHDGKDGEGGSDSTSTADDGGQPGVGGFSVDDDGTDNGWAGSSVTLDDWSHGYGGTSGNDGGGGGGFGGGGHGNKDGRNYSGGGGGGSWALQNSVASDSTFQVGQDGYDEPGVILTFETSPTS
jgi:hypothetical protein